jgi:hypothetical protein
MFQQVYLKGASPVPILTPSSHFNTYYL